MVVACVTNKMLKRPTNHIVVGEPGLPLLEENRRRNDCRFVIEAVAIGYGTDTIEFTVQDKFLFGRLQSPGGRSVRVPTASLGGLIEKYGFETINLMCDIEGTEVPLVENEAEILRSRVKNLIMETHGGISRYEPDRQDDCDPERTRLRAPRAVANRSRTHQPHPLIHVPRRQAILVSRTISYDGRTMAALPDRCQP